MFVGIGRYVFILGYVLFGFYFGCSVLFCVRTQIDQVIRIAGTQVFAQRVPFKLVHILVTVGGCASGFLLVHFVRV